MAWVAILVAFAALIVAVTVLAIVVVVWLASGGEGDDWAGERARYDDVAGAAEPGGDYSATAPGPHYHLALLNDDTHSFAYVIKMLRDVFGIPANQGYALAREIHEQGRGVVFTGSLDEVNNKRTQVIEYGPDPWAPSKTVEPLGVVIEKAS
jgi:ATP-dependent Clp protease adapter protein ClpS